MKEYEINIECMALVPIEENITQVYEVYSEFMIKDSVSHIVDSSCRYYGSSLDGRKKGTENLIGIKYKAPIIVEETNDIIFFPLASIRNQETIWINVQYVDKYEKNKNGVLLYFKNGQNMLLSCSYGVLENQVLRATRLESALRARKNAKKRFKLENHVI